MWKTKLIRQTFVMIGVALLVVACGGGGGGGAAEPTRAFNITITIADTTLSSNRNDFIAEPGSDFATTVTVRVTQTNGNAVADGTTVSFSVNDSNLGLFSTTAVLATQTPTLSVQTAGGSASAVFHTSDGDGTAVITASAFDPTANRNVTTTSNLQIAQGPDPIQRLTLEAQRVRIPANQFGLIPFIGSPFLSEVTISFRNDDGVLSAPSGGTVGVSIAPLSVAAFSTLDDPATPDNEIEQLIGNGPVDAAAGTATVLISSFSTPGVATLRVTAQDATDAEEFEATLDVEVIEPEGDGRPANVSINAPGTPLYIQNSGGTTSTAFQIVVADGGDNTVADPGTNNNVLLEVFSESPDSGEELSAVDANGNNVSGRSIAVATTAGISGANLRSGNEPGLTRVRATADASDNNVSNGIQVPVISESTFVISDGIPFSVTLTTIPVNSLTVNPVSNDVTLMNPDPNADPIPVNPNATYSLLVSAIVTDRRGNPPAVPAALDFGTIDAPLEGFPFNGPGTFSLSGVDGDPAEGNVGFAAPFGEFQTAGGGAGRDDTILVFGKSVVGNADLESVRSVLAINSQTNLTVDEPFNFNDTTGVSVNNGPVIPYVIGRATTANINTSAITDANGIATTTLNYPVSRLGQTAAIFVQGTNGSLGSAGDISTYADVGLIRYPGLRDLSLTASPDMIPANTTVNVTVCLQDAALVPIAGQFIDFAFQGGSGVNDVDGTIGSGVVGNPTGSNGCTVAAVTTSGVLVGSEDFSLIFSVGDATAEVMIISPGDAVILLDPSAITIQNFLTNRTIDVTYVDGSGVPVENIQIVVTCMVTDGSAGVIGSIAPTDANGMTEVVIQARLDDGTFDTNVGSGTCEFTTASGEPTATLQLNGFDFCANSQNISPPPPVGACGDEVTNRTVAVLFQRAAGNVANMGTVNVVSVPAGINCSFNFVDDTTTGMCSDPNIPNGSDVTLGFSPGSTMATAVFSGDCFANNGNRWR